MARKRKKVKDLRGIDPESPAYWEEILQRERLQMARGRHEKLSYIGSAQNVDYVNDVISTKNGRVTPKGGAE
jgi:hypothetical protein